MAKQILVTCALLCALLCACTALPTEGRRDNIDERGDLFEGDILLPPGGRVGTHDQSLRWPNCTVYYVIDPAFQSQEVIIQAMEEISNSTGIMFIERTDQRNYVFVQRGESGSGCYSYIGMIGGAQVLNLQDPGCVHRGIVMHEFLHALGFYHEQSRPDRDDFVIINWDNIPAGLWHNFQKTDRGYVDTYGPYDYNSLMHYSRYAFAMNPNEPTILPRYDKEANIGQRERLSDWDVEGVIRMYGCRASTSDSQG